MLALFKTYNLHIFKALRTGKAVIRSLELMML